MDHRLIAPRAGILIAARDFSAPPETVWGFWTKADQRAQWLAGGEDIVAPDRPVNFVFDRAQHGVPISSETGEAEGVARVEGYVSAFERPTVLGLELRGSGSMATTLTVSLRGRDDGHTDLRLVHERVPKDELVQAAAGWHAHLDLLLACLEGSPPPDFTKRFAQLLEGYQEDPPGTE